MISNELRKDRSFHRYLILETMTNPARVTQNPFKHFWGKYTAIFSVHVATLSMFNLPLSRKVSQPQFHWKEKQRKLDTIRKAKERRRARTKFPNRFAKENKKNSNFGLCMYANNKIGA